MLKHAVRVVSGIDWVKVLKFLAVLAVIILLGMLVFSNRAEQETIGSREVIVLETPQGSTQMVAKIDTGADSTSIDERTALSLGLKPLDEERTIILDPRTVQVRKTIALEFTLGDKTVRTIGTVADRSTLSTKIIIGRGDLDGLSINPSREFLATPLDAPVGTSLRQSFLTLIGDPATQQLVVIPILAMVTLILRLLVGVRTYGIFGPLIISLSLTDLGILSGLGLYILLLVIVVAVRLVFLRSASIPLAGELTILLFLMVLVLFGISASNIFPSLSLTNVFFPLIVTAYLVERFTRSVYEDDTAGAFWLTVATLLTACGLALLNKFLLSIDLRSVWILFFAALSITLLVSRYTGLRLMEIIRFKSVLGGPADEGML